MDRKRLGLRITVLLVFAFLFVSFSLHTSTANAGLFDWLFGKKEKREKVIKIGAILPR